MNVRFGGNIITHQNNESLLKESNRQSRHSDIVLTTHSDVFVGSKVDAVTALVKADRAFVYLPGHIAGHNGFYNIVDNHKLKALLA